VESDDALGRVRRGRDSRDGERAGVRPEQALLVAAATAAAGAVVAADLAVTTLVVGLAGWLFGAGAFSADIVDAVLDRALVARAVKIGRAASVRSAVGRFEVLIADFVISALSWRAAVEFTLIGSRVANLSINRTLRVGVASLSASTVLTDGVAGTFGVVGASGQQAGAAAAILVLVLAIEVDLAAIAAGHDTLAVPALRTVSRAVVVRLTDGCVIVSLVRRITAGEQTTAHHEASEKR
jgi:hypothetical protein